MESISREKMTLITSTMKKLQSQKASFEPAWKAITKYIFQESDCWQDIDPDEAGVANLNEKYDSTAAVASDLMAQGLQGYGYGRNTDWLAIKLEGLKQPSKSIKGYLQFVTSQASASLKASNFYQEAENFTKCGINLGTAIMTMGYDESVGASEYHTRHIKDCLIMENRFGKVDTLCYAFWLNKSDAMEYFGEDCPSIITQSKDESKNYKFWHLICKRYRFKLQAEDGDKEWVNIQWFDSVPDKAIKAWSENTSNFAVWRWARMMGGPSWGWGSPGTSSISDVKMLNGMMESYLSLTQYASWPMVKKTEGLEVDVKPEGQVALGANQDFSFVSPVGDATGTFSEMDRIRKSINQIYYADFFLVLKNNLEKTKTATEVNGIQEEQARIMSSFLSRLESEFFEPIVEHEYEMLVMHGADRDSEHPFPEELDGKTLKVDFDSPLARIQRSSMVLSPIRSLISEAASLAQIDPNILAKLKLGKYLDKFADINNVDVECLVDEKEYEAILQQRAQAQAQQQQLENQLAIQKAGGDAYKSATQAPQQGSPAEQMMRTGA